MIKELFLLKPAVYGRYDEIEMLPVFKKNGVKFIIYGAGRGGELFMSLVNRIYNIKPDYIIDKMPVSDFLDGVQVISPEQFKKLKIDKFVIAVTVLKYYMDDTVSTEIDELIYEIGKNARYVICRIDNIFEPYRLNWFYYVKENSELFERTYNWLTGSLSKETMEYYLRTIILGERYSGVTLPERYKYWGIDDNENRLFELSGEEVVLNVGAARGDTVFEYLNSNILFKKLIAVEASSKEYSKLEKNINLLSENIIERMQLDNVFLDGEDNSIDNLYRDEEISLINMDIEGAELEVLKSAVNTICNKRPILSICVYHKVEDLIDIPTWIKSKVDDYIFELRKYPTQWYDGKIHVLHQNELVLYAIPIERYKLKK